MKYMVNVGVMVTADYKNMFHERCVSNGTTMSAVMRDAIAKYLESHQPVVRKMDL